ncbi:Fic family protein [Inquilinus limosus]|uniref:Cell filamentation protein Fic n=1 Tax=Inquilinus limosus TaxID=171674 RepID=A0A211ZN04_9PROT|nr:Fic family protein [Inquilinus limosus]OWJ66554.1 cell filamentation protein Fic [Inquilinus limosus]
MLVLEEENRDLYDRIQEKNLIRQYDLLLNCVEIGISQGGRVFDKYMLWDLNHVAVANISQFGGRFRDEPIYVGSHIPPHFREVPMLMDQFISTIHENWYNWSYTELAAYGLWRMNWVHPFIEGNGRTARAACYYLLCAKAGGVLGGRKIVPERIRENREPYYAALNAADRAWEDGNLDFSMMEEYLAGLVQEQLQDEGLSYQGGT